MSAVVGRCLRCGKRRRLHGWQCESCHAEFGDPSAAEAEAIVAFLEREERWIEKAADLIDGAGFWAAARSAWNAAERVHELIEAIEEG